LKIADGGLVDLRRVDVSAPGVVVATTGQGSEITFGLDNLEQQLRRWRQIYDYARQKIQHRGGGLGGGEQCAGALDGGQSRCRSVTPKAVKPAKTRRKNV
jgi:hypothetical protein